MNRERWCEKRGRCANCWPFRNNPSTHIVKMPPARRLGMWPDQSTSPRPRPRRWYVCGAHAAQLVRFHRRVGVDARAYRYRRFRGTQPQPTPAVLLSGY